MQSKNIFNLIYAIFFGTVAGIVLCAALSVFVPQFYTETVGSLVCPGRIEFITFKQSYYCFTATNTSFDIGNAMYWIVFKRAIVPSIIVSILLAAGFIELVKYLWRHREAAGF